MDASNRLITIQKEKTHETHRSCHRCACRFAVSFGASAAGAVSYTGGTYQQSFDGLPGAGPNEVVSGTLTGRGPHGFSAATVSASDMEGWYFGNPGGSSGNTEFKAQDGSFGSGAGRGVVSFGSASSTDRALGLLPTSNQIGHFGVLIVIDSAATIDEIVVSFTGEQWRRGNVAVANSLDFAYGLGISINDSLSAFPALSLISPVMSGPTEVALDGNIETNQTMVSANLTDLNWGVGQTLVMRWSIADLSGQDNGLAIDNFSITPVPEPETYALMLAGLGLIGYVARRRPAKRA